MGDTVRRLSNALEEVRKVATRSKLHKIAAEHDNAYRGKKKKTKKSKARKKK
jgi:hypothetical protein